MVRPLTGMREVFRRLEEREEGRTRRQFEREELMGVEHDENLNDYRGYWDTVYTAEHVERQVRQSQLYNSFIINDPPRDVGSNIRGQRASFMYVDWDIEYNPFHERYDMIGGRSVGRTNAMEYAEAIVRMQNGSEHAVRIPQYQKDFLYSLKSFRSQMSSKNKIFRPYTWISYGIVDDFFSSSGGIFFDPYRHTIVHRAILYKTDDEETVVFGTKESFVRQLMEDKLLEFFGLTKQQIKTKRLIDAKAPMKSFTRLLLRKEKR